MIIQNQVKDLEFHQSSVVIIDFVNYDSFIYTLMSLITYNTPLYYRKWFQLLSAEVFNVYHGLFEHSARFVLLLRIIPCVCIESHMVNN